MGRSHELARLVEAGDAVLRGDRRVALVSGEAGVGKSRLVNELTSWLRGGGCRVMVGRCIEFGDQIWPFAALRELLASLLDVLDREQLDFVLSGDGALLRHLVPELGVPSPARTAIDPDRMCEAVIGVLRRLGQWGPVAVIVEDLHWADDSTRALFSLVARSSRPTSLLLVGTHRDDDATSAQPLSGILVDVMRSSRPEHVELHPFDRDTTAELVTALVMDGLSASEVDEIHRLSGGNAFYIEELVAAGADRTFTRSLRNVILTRAATVCAAGRDVLAAVAIAGRLPAPAVPLATGLPALRLSSVVEELLASGLLASDGGELRFRHELARAVIADDLHGDLRVELHAAVAGALETSRPERLGEIARHWSAADRPEQALVAWIAAGREAMQSGMPREALGHFGEALSVWTGIDDPERVAGCDRPRVLLDAAECAYHGQKLDRAIELTTTAIAELDGRDPLREGEAWLRLRMMYRFSNRWDDCARAAERALHAVPTSPPSRARVQALVDATLGRCYVGQIEAARRYAEEALDVATALSDDVEALITARYAVGASAAATEEEDLQKLVRYQFETVALCDETVSPERRLFAYNGLTNALVRVSRLPELVDVAAAGVALVRRTGLGGPLATAMAEYWVGSLVSLGRWDEAERVYDDVREILAETDERDPLHHMEMAWIRQGRLDDARPTVEQIRRLLQDPEFWVEVLVELAWLVIEFDAAEHRYREVHILVDDILRRTAGTGTDDVWCLLVGAFTALADHGVMPGADDEIAEVAARWTTEAESRHVALAGENVLLRDRAYAELNRCRRRSDPAEWTKIADGYEQLGFRYDEALARFRTAEALLSGISGRSVQAHHDAVEALRRCKSLAAMIPAPPLLHQVESLACSARLNLDMVPAEPPPHTPADALGLTHREADVLQLVAAGLSNGDIGQRLFISRKTASVHVSNILRKLGVSNRIEAAGILHRISLESDGAASANGFDS